MFALPKSSIAVTAEPIDVILYEFAPAEVPIPNVLNPVSVPPVVVNAPVGEDKPFQTMMFVGEVPAVIGAAA